MILLELLPTDAVWLLVPYSSLRVGGIVHGDS